MVAALLLLALLLLALLRPISSHPFTLAALLRARSPRCAAPRLASRVTYLAVARSASTSLRHAVLRYHKHHDHDCTLADMARVADASGRPVGLVLVVLRPGSVELGLGHLWAPSLEPLGDVVGHPGTPLFSTLVHHCGGPWGNVVRHP